MSTGEDMVPKPTDQVEETRHGDDDRGTRGSGGRGGCCDDVDDDDDDERRIGRRRRRFQVFAKSRRQIP